ncbi:MAG: carbohydrate ABC transporter permease [Bacilli bacterium]|jgi:multiple sugar transport system permease protein
MMAKKELKLATATTGEVEETLTVEEMTALEKIEQSQRENLTTYKKPKENKGSRIVIKILIYLFLTLFALFILVPFWFMIVTSLKHPTTYNKEVTEGALKLFTGTPTFINFRIILGGNLSQAQLNSLGTQLSTIVQSKAHNFLPYFLNTIIVALISTLFTVFTTILCAFAFARLEFKGKNVLFAILLATMMVPGEMMIITNFQTTVGIGWTNTFAALIFVHGVSVFYIFQLRMTFQQIPNELFLASKVDGFGEFNYLWRVMIPIAMPTIVTITILNVMGAWNAFIWPNLIATGNNAPLENWFGVKHTMKLVSNGLMSLFTSEFSSHDTVKIAGSMIISSPLLIVFIFFRKYIMRGVSRSGIKG